MMSNKELVFIENNRVLTDSLTVAECFGKEHKHVLRDIEVQLQKLKEAGEEEWIKNNYKLTKYQHPQNKQWYKKYLLTKEAYMQLTNKYIMNSLNNLKIDKIKEFDKQLGVNRNLYVFHYERGENLIYNILKNTFKNEIIHRQYPVLNYRLDFYLEYLNIIIEYDEYHHKYRKYYDDKRMNEIIEYMAKMKFLEDGLYSIKQLNEKIHIYKPKFIRIKEGEEMSVIYKIVEEHNKGINDSIDNYILINNKNI